MGRFVLLQHCALILELNHEVNQERAQTLSWPGRSKIKMWQHIRVGENYIKSYGWFPRTEEST